MKDNHMGLQMPYYCKPKVTFDESKKTDVILEDISVLNRSFKNNSLDMNNMFLPANLCMIANDVCDKLKQ